MDWRQRRDMKLRTRKAVEQTNAEIQKKKNHGFLHILYRILHTNGQPASSQIESTKHNYEQKSQNEGQIYQTT